MKMSLEDAKYCLCPKLNGCRDCKFDKQGEFDCRGTALSMGADALNFLILGKKLSDEAEEKER